MQKWIREQKPNVFLWTPICLAMGIGLYFTLSFEPNLCALISTLVLGISILIWKRKYPIAILLACFISGFSYAGIYTHIKNVPYLSHDIHNIQINGRITNIDYTNEKLRLYIQTPEYGTIRVSTQTNNKYNIGNIVSGHGGLFKPKPAAMPSAFDFARWEYFKGISAIGYINDIKTVYTAESAVYNIRNNVKNLSNSFLTDTLILGYKNALPEGHHEIWNINGISHIWSISGYHITLVMGWLFIIFYLVFRFCPKIVRRIPARIPAMICAWIGVIAYVLLSGGSVATLRAFIMATLIILAFIFGRNVISLRMASVAFIVLSLINPHYVTQAGFQLSFSAIFGILWLWTTVNPKLPQTKILKYIYATLLTTLVATLFTTPIALAHFGKMAIYGVIGNLIFLPLFSFVVMPLVIIGTICALIGISSILSYSHNVYDILFNIAEHITQLPSAEITFNIIPNTAFVCFILALSCLIFIRNLDTLRNALFRHINLILSGIFSILGTIICTLTQRPIFYISNDHKLIGAVIDGKLQFNKSHDSGNYFAFDTWKQSNNEPTGTENHKLPKKSGVYIIPYDNWSIVYIQNFVPLSKNISNLCANQNIKYIVSYFDINPSSECSNKIINGGGVVYKSGKIIHTISNRWWHNRPE